MIAYVDTHVLVWVLEGNLQNLSAPAKKALNSADLLVSPVVLLELEYLYEIRRITLTARDIRSKMERELKARVCDLPFSRVIEVALDESWTRDPFDRTIVAQAKANGLSALITADEKMRKHYPRCLW